MQAMHRRERERGAGVVELIVAIAVLSLLFAGISASMVAGSSLDRNTAERDLAREGARGRLEAILGWPDHTSVGPVFRGTTFSVDGLIHPDGPDTPVGRVFIDSGNPDLLAITIRVDWSSDRGPENLELRTLRANTDPQ